AAAQPASSPDERSEIREVPPDCSPAMAGVRHPERGTSCRRLSAATGRPGSRGQNPDVASLIRATLAERPGGLRNGIAGLTPASGTSGKDQIIVDDLQALATAIAPVAGNGNIVLVASPDAAVALHMRLLRPEWPVLVSAQLPTRTVIMVAANAIVSAVDGAPMVDASSQTAFVRDTVPQEIVTAGGTPATSVGSVYQTDEVLLRLRWPISWGLRSSNALSWMQSVNW